MAQGTTDAIDRIRADLPTGARIVFVSGNFNILHPGHLRLLHFAAECGECLVVGINPDGARGAHMPAALRLESVRSIACVDHAVLLEPDAAGMVELLRPDIVIKGKEHEAGFNPERAVLDAYGGKLLFNSGELAFSSIELLRQEFSRALASTIHKPLDFPQRHAFRLPDLAATVLAFRTIRVLVLGDLIVDEYIACDPIGMSQEDPTIVVAPLFHERFVGGAGIVAGHAAGLGAKVSFCTVVGQDAGAEFAAERLRSYGVDAVLLPDPTRPTTLKQRFRAVGKTLLRVNHHKHHAMDAALQERFLDAVRERLDRTDLVIFSDFSYGCLPQRVVDRVCELAASRGITMVADSQSSSQVGDIARFKGMLLIKPTEREARLALRDFESGLVVVAQAIAEKAEARNVVVTLGGDGLVVHGRDSEVDDAITDRLAAFNTAPKDVAGAGDSFLVCAALSLAAGGDIWRSSYLGSLAAAEQVGRIGNTPLTAAALLREIEV